MKFLILVGPSCRKTVGQAVNREFTRHVIGKASTFEICMMSRDDTYLRANGITWNTKDRECSYTFNASSIRKEDTDYQACILDGSTFDDKDIFA